ncbi:glycosyltransferase family 8 protein [Exidia glandulosa HHB12029]|uniref:Glycosyltransferase family 8 protein n=1 Tax=Exidia glandulosa HHB12029 TaxID=1314781 RepID=A0A165CPE4_EXIGL|nr:glycosyltransferase family 8 protein [Exidia glandulosa HHB12029]
MVARTRSAYVTLLTKPSYLAATLVLERSLRSVASAYPLVVMVTPQLPEQARGILRRRNIVMRDVEELHPPGDRHQLSAVDERFRDTWTKLRAFELVEYDRVVLLDSDMIVKKNMDELMTLDLPIGCIAAVHACACNPRRFAHYPKDWVPENCAYTPLEHPASVSRASPITAKSPRPYRLLNSGNVVLRPSMQQFDALTRFLATSELVSRFTFPDQDLLAKVYEGKWKPLPYVYNAMKAVRVVHRRMWRDEEVKCLHYALPDKPWHGFPVDNDPFDDLHKWWWTEFDVVRAEMRCDRWDDLMYVEQNTAALVRCGQARHF